MLGLSTSAGDVQITGWSVDSRTVQPGDLFFALPGPNHDGNAYVDEAIRKGAAAAIASGSPARQQGDSGQVLTVPDTLAALQQIATWARTAVGG